MDFIYGLWLGPSPPPSIHSFGLERKAFLVLCAIHLGGWYELGILMLRGVPSAHGLCWVDLDFDCYTVCLILPGLRGIWLKWLGSWAR